MLIQISSGKGPHECELAVGKFLKIFMKEVKKAKIIQEVKGQYVDCYKSVLLSVDEDVSHLEGTIKWIVQSPFRPKHKRKNWFIDIRIFNEQEKIDFSEKFVRFETFRCGGNGGQNVNKVETGVRAIHLPTGLAVVSTEARTQYLNKKLALNRLSQIISKQNLDAEILAKQTMWIQHELLVRGNPIRIYEGLTFKQIG
ncbi:MAG: peptide chain release factor H [Thermotaleaceae bacterium]